MAESLPRLHTVPRSTIHGKLLFGLGRLHHNSYMNKPQQGNPQRGTTSDNFKAAWKAVIKEQMARPDSEVMVFRKDRTDDGGVEITVKFKYGGV